MKRQPLCPLLALFFLFFQTMNAKGVELIPSIILQASSSTRCWHFDAHVLATPKTRQIGFSGQPLTVSALLFVWPQTQARNFWMKNTHIRIHLFRVDQTGQVETHDQLDPGEAFVYRDPSQGRYAVEIRSDWLDTQSSEALQHITKFSGGPFGSSTRTGCQPLQRPSRGMIPSH